MLEKFKGALKELEESNEFKEWKNNNKNSFLSNGFTILDSDFKPEDIDWEINYYNPDKKNITSFIIKNKKIGIKDNQEVFSGEHEFKELELDNLKVDVKDIIKLIEGKYKEKANKIILILQNLGKTAWSVTLLTNSFKIINFNVDCSNGNILNEEIRSVAEFRGKQN